jgi:hypothetical protein
MLQGRCSDHQLKTRIDSELEYPGTFSAIEPQTDSNAGVPRLLPPAVDSDRLGFGVTRVHFLRYNLRLIQMPVLPGSDHQLKTRIDSDLE